MGSETIGDRALGRATLARQLLLERTVMSPLDAVEHLTGLQAQEPPDPYLALWSRLDAFEARALSDLLVERALVRIVVMRGTIHLVTAADACVMRPLTQEVVDAEIRRHPEFAPQLVGVDVEPVLVFARGVLAAHPSTPAELRAAIAERYPGLPAAALAYACRCLMPLVQVPPRATWGSSGLVGGQVRLAPLEEWTGRTVEQHPSIDALVLRYLAAFGPASVVDVTAWSRLRAMREVLERLRPSLRTFRDARGRELFDIPDAPRPDPDTPAPVRVLPEYDNALLSFVDRARFGSGAQPAVHGAAGPYKGCILVDGTVGAIWHVVVARTGRSAPGDVTMVVEHGRLDRRALHALEAEAVAALRFRHPAATAHRVELRPAG